MKVGQQRRIPAAQPGTKQKRHVFGGYNGMSDQITWTTAETKHNSQFICFLEQLLVKEYPTGRVVLVMDNASHHKSASASATLSLFEHRVMVVWLPPYCSDLNPIERFWRHLKDRACANKLQDTIEAVIDSAEQVLIEQNRAEQVSVFHILKNLRRFT